MKWKILLFVLLLTIPSAIASLSCSISNSTCVATDVFHISNLSNAHAEQNNESDYDYIVCCNETGGATLNTTIGTAIINLSTSTNAHVEQNNETDYPFSVLLSASMGNITCEYSTSNCTEACLGSISTNITGSYTNLHIAQCNDYATNICCHYNSTTTPSTPSGAKSPSQVILDIKEFLCTGEWINDECIKDEPTIISWWLILGILFIIGMIINLIVKKKTKEKEGGKKKWWKSVWARLSSSD